MRLLDRNQIPGTIRIGALAALGAVIVVLLICSGLGAFFLGNWGSGQVFDPLALMHRLHRGMPAEEVERLLETRIVLRVLDSPVPMGDVSCESAASISEYGLGANFVSQHWTHLYFHKGRLQGWTSKRVTGGDEIRTYGIFPAEVE